MSEQVNGSGRKNCRTGSADGISCEAVRKGDVTDGKLGRVGQVVT